MYWFKWRCHANDAGALHRVIITVRMVVKSQPKLSLNKCVFTSAVVERRWRMKQFGWQVVGCSTPAMQCTTRSPRVDRCTDGTTSVMVVEQRRCRRPSTSVFPRSKKMVIKHCNVQSQNPAFTVCRQNFLLNVAHGFLVLRQTFISFHPTLLWTAVYTALMFLQMIGLAETFVTQCALERFISRVDSHVFLQISCLRKCFLTHVTFVRFLSTVNSTVHNKVNWCRKSFTTNGAFKRFHSRMASSVYC